MSEKQYIKLDAVLDYIRNRAPIPANAVGAVYVDIKALPAAPVREVVRGRWIYKTMTVPGGKGQTFGKWVCSECKSKEKERRNWCPNCGADMREEEGGAT